MERKLASIQRIINLSPIENAENIERADILGWQCVVKKGEFKVNDLVVYCEVDSLLPRTTWSEFLFKSAKDNVEKFRLRTVRLRGQVSQGIVFPINILKYCLCIGDTLENSMVIFPEGHDVTELLGIVQYQPTIPAQLQGMMKGNFPSWLSKTDETRIQAVPWVLEKHKGKKFYITEKLDGSSMTVYLDQSGEFGVCSRNLDLKETEGNSFWKVARELDLENKLRKYNGPIAVQGELIGPGIQNNKYDLKQLEFRVFNVVDSQGYFHFELFKAFCQDNELMTVPIVGEDIELNHELHELVTWSNEKSMLNRQLDREGLVFRPLVEEREDKLGRLSWKVINPEFLLKHKE